VGGGSAPAWGIAMQQSIGRTRVVRLGFYFATVALVGVVWIARRHMDAAAFGGIIFSSSSTSDPNQWQQMGLQAISEMNTLLTTLATALLGALGLLLSSGARNRPRTRHLWSAFISALMVGVSIYFGYVGHLHVLWMIKNENFDPNSLVYILPSYSQFYALLIAVFFFADFAVHDLIEEKSDERGQDAIGDRNSSLLGSPVLAGRSYTDASAARQAGD
jgi:hypothetical protein